MFGDNKKRKPGRPPGSKNRTALVRLDKAAAVVAAQLSAAKAGDKLYTLGGLMVRPETSRVSLCPTQAPSS